MLHASFNYSIIGLSIRSSRHNKRTFIKTIKSKKVLTDCFLNKITKFFYKTKYLPDNPATQMIESTLLSVLNNFTLISIGIFLRSSPDQLCLTIAFYLHSSFLNIMYSSSNALSSKF